MAGTMTDSSARVGICWGPAWVLMCRDQSGGRNLAGPSYVSLQDVHLCQSADAIEIGTVAIRGPSSHSIRKREPDGILNPGHVVTCAFRQASDGVFTRASK